MGNLVYGPQPSRLVACRTLDSGPAVRASPGEPVTPSSRSHPDCKGSARSAFLADFRPLQISAVPSGTLVPPNFTRTSPIPKSNIGAVRAQGMAQGPGVRNWMGWAMAGQLRPGRTVDGGQAATPPNDRWTSMRAVMASTTSTRCASRSRTGRSRRVAKPLEDRRRPPPRRRHQLPRCLSSLTMDVCVQQERIHTIWPANNGVSPIF